MSLTLLTRSNVVISTVVWQFWGSGWVPQVSALGVILILFATIVVGMLTEIPKLPLLIAIILAVILVLLISNKKAISNNDGWGAMKYPQLIFGMIAIFVYVGVEVTIDNNFGALLKVPGYFNETGLDESEISKYVTLYWGSLMIGRWTGAVSIFNLKGNSKVLAMIVVPFIAFAMILFVNYL